MIFEPLPLQGAYHLRLEPLVDRRGFFARTFCSRTFAEHGLNPDLIQCSISFNSDKHTLRGMHLQLPPHEETKLVRCTQGASHHVILDLRKGSKTYTESVGIELSARERGLLYVPEGVAHGFITLEDNTEIFYQISREYVPGFAFGVRWDDPAFRMEWPYVPKIMSQRDLGFPDYRNGPD